MLDVVKDCSCPTFWPRSPNTQRFESRTITRGLLSVDRVGGFFVRFCYRVGKLVGIDVLTEFLETSFERFCFFGVLSALARGCSARRAATTASEFTSRRRLRQAPLMNSLLLV